MKRAEREVVLPPLRFGGLRAFGGSLESCSRTSPQQTDGKVGFEFGRFWMKGVTDTGAL